MLAQGSLGELRVITRFLKPPKASLKVGLLQEALSSSRIEGTQATLSEVLLAEVEDAIESFEVQDVLSYQTALEHALEQLKTIPISRRLVCSTHKVLMSGARNVSKKPGEFRTSPVWIGAYDSTPEKAKYIPPLPHHLTELFADWEKFVNQAQALPLVAHLAWAHYQFESIHPFMDGNGRIGRIIFELMLVSKGSLDGPYLGISRYIERYKNEYLEVLGRVRTHGDIDGLFRYFSAAIETQAQENISRFENLIQLRDLWQSRAAGGSKHFPELIRCLIEQPITNVAFVKTALGISQPTASKLLRQAEELGMVTSRGQVGRGRKETWISEPIWQVFSPFEAP